MKLTAFKRASLAVALAAPGMAQAEVDAPAPTPAPLTGPICEEGSCKIRLTADQLLATAEKLVTEHRFDEAAPMLAALENAPQLAMEREFLMGYTAVEKGDLAGGIKLFRKILNKHPDQTRVRLELGRALLMQGKPLSADHHLRLAQGDKALPDNIARMVRNTRGVIRDQRNWSFNMDFGVAPDSNITNGTNADTIDVNLGPITVPLTLNQAAKRQSGTGQFATVNSTGRFGFIGESRLLVEANSQFTNYKGKSFDDAAVELAAGPEFDLGSKTRLAVQALGAHRWYGGKRANFSMGMRSSIQHELGDRDRIGFSIDARKSNSGFSSDYDGWQFGGFASYERVIGKSFIGSATVFGRRDSLKSKSYANVEVGANIGIGGDLPLGLSGSVSGGVSKAWYDGALQLFSNAPRKDLRLNARVSLGVRSMRVFGFSPSVSYNWSRSKSNLQLFDNERSRLRFALARYF